MRKHRKLFFSLFLVLILSVNACIIGQASEFEADETVSMMGTAYWNLSPKQQYSFFVVRHGTDTSSAIAAENLLYMDQATADSSGSISFVYLPSEAVHAQTLLRGKNCDSAKEVTWLYSNDGTLTVLGTGEIPSFDVAPWASVQDDISKLVFTESITQIGSSVFVSCDSLATIVFEGNAPVFNSEVFAGINATVYYPEDNTTWTEDVLQNYGGNITWVVDHEHSYGDWTLATAPGCETEGVEESVCSCGDKLTRNVDALGHDLISVVTPPTCTEKGYTTHSCSRCDLSYIDTYVDALGHSFTDYVSDDNATCTEDGTQTAVCDNCDEEDTIVDVGSATGHDWDDGEITEEPAIGAEGEITYTCGNCGETKTEVIPALPDEPVDEPCSHSSVKLLNQKEATCTSSGYSGDRVCAKCQVIIQEGSVTPAFGHSEVIDEAISPFCTVDGWTEGMHCSVCHTTLVERKVIPATGHNFGTWIETIPATSQSMGEEMRTCDTCFIEEHRSIDKLVNPFVDVGAGAYYEAPVLWAVSKGITNGMSPNTFGPDLQCTRNQVVTFLWRAAGSPEPTSKVNPFVDVKESDYFYKAVLWAVEEGITNGMDATHFGSENECTRAQVATFLWRAQGEPKAANKSHPFTDIKSGDYYYEAVLWAVEAGVTNGMSPTTFAPNSTCTRGQIVTFLYRALK